MDYNLAKQLKDVGYPQGKGIVFYDQEHNEHLVTPTLSELIEACGDSFFKLTLKSSTSDGKIWLAENINFLEVIGSTPEEAVAKLYLQINQK